ncbi:MAG: hypothetical protein AAFN09_17590, partial [Pseudomonadota bacterium]
KTYILKRKQCSNAHILSEKRPFSQKHCALMSFFHEKRPAAMPTFGKKTSILSKLQHIIGKKVKGCPFFPTFH